MSTAFIAPPRLRGIPSMQRRTSATRTRHLLAALLLGITTVGAHASSASPTAAPNWTPTSLTQALRALPAGDAARGKLLHAEFQCASCHGNNGNATTRNWPSLAGQRADYTAKMLLDYRSGLRREDERAGLMTDIARLLSPQQIADLASYYATLPLPAAPQASAQPTPALTAAQKQRAERLVRQGDPSRLLTPCASCHGLNGEGRGTTPALAGQTESYLLRTMRLYHGNARHNDVYQGMRQFAQRLGPEDTALLARYYAAMQPRTQSAKVD